MSLGSCAQREVKIELLWYQNGHSYSCLYFQSESEEWILPELCVITKMVTAKRVIYCHRNTIRNMETIPHLQPHKSETLFYIASRPFIINMKLSFMVFSLLVCFSFYCSIFSLFLMLTTKWKTWWLVGTQSWSEKYLFHCFEKSRAKFYFHIIYIICIYITCIYIICIYFNKI